MLGAIHTVTISTADLQHIEDAYCRYFEYQVVDRSPISASLAASWDAPDSAGAAALLMQPASGAQNYLRFVESVPVPEYTPLRTFGWNAIEIIVQDLNALNERLLDSPFEIIGTPAVLAFDFTDAISAMQVIGPAGEVLYLTMVSKDAPGLDLPRANAFVDQTFIMVLGGQSLVQASSFYADTFGAQSSPPMDGTIRVLNRAFDRPPKTKTTIATISLPGQTLIELDEMPDQTIPRPSHTGCLPPAAAIVSFQHDDLSQIDSVFITAPEIRQEAPYYGHRAATLRGATGELIELIEKR